MRACTRVKNYVRRLKILHKYLFNNLARKKFKIDFRSNPYTQISQFYFPACLRFLICSHKNQKNIFTLKFGQLHVLGTYIWKEEWIIIFNRYKLISLNENQVSNGKFLYIYNWRS